MKIRGIRLQISTDEGLFGFQFRFAEGLTIVRGSNSSGKSTFFNSMLYGLGLEELVGGRDERALPYAVKEFFTYDGRRIDVISSSVFVELENADGDVVTFRRAISEQTKSQKLIESFNGSIESVLAGELTASPHYLHDPGSAQKEGGYFHFFEKFLGMSLPSVPTTSGGEVKLYIQSVFAALAVEQKRGWTDYIANIPYYAIKDSRSRVVEYLLGLNAFSVAAEKNRLSGEVLGIEMRWSNLREDIRQRAESLGIAFEGVPVRVVADFSPTQMILEKRHDGEQIPLREYVSRIRNEHQALQAMAEDATRISGEVAVRDVDAKASDVQQMSLVYSQAASSLEIKRLALKDYQQLASEVRADLDRNRVAKKLNELGAEHSISLALDVCPTCQQPVQNSLLLQQVAGPQMDISTNISYLESQLKMLDRQVTGLNDDLAKSEAEMADLSRRLSAKQDELNALRGDITSGSSRSRSAMRRQLQIEAEVLNIERFYELFATSMDSMRNESINYAEAEAQRRALPESRYSQEDQRRIDLFEKMFRANAGSFGYESAAIADIEINRDTLVPYLAQLELRQIRSDIKADSSASDFVRLIWSYLIALYQTSIRQKSRRNHPGILCFDEPGQHSMAEDSQRALLQHLAAEEGLQAIVAASFDESESVFLQATQGVKFELIKWDGKLISKLPDAMA